MTTDHAAIESSLTAWKRAQEATYSLKKVFVVGCPKSGTTWLLNLLNGHPRVVINGEGCIGYQLFPLLRAAMQQFNKHQERMLEVTRLRDCDLLFTLRNLADIQLARYIEGSGKNLSDLQYVGDKTPQHTIGMDLLNQIYPQARFIHIIRDPRDAAVSAWHHFGKSDGRSFVEYMGYFLTKVWPLNVASARKSGAAFGDRYWEVRYEELVNDEAAQIRRLLSFLQVDQSPQCVRTCMDAGSFEKRSGGRKRGQTKSDEFYRSGQAGAWSRDLAPTLAHRYCAAIAPLMTSCGYEPNNQEAPISTETS